MRGLQRFFPFRFSMRGRSLRVRIVFLVSALLLVSYLAEFFVLRYDERNWEYVAEEKADAELRMATDAFSGIQREVRRLGTDIAQHRRVLAVLKDENGNRPALFAFVSRVAREQQVGIEVYNLRGQLVAWEGVSEPTHPNEIEVALAGKLSSFVTRSQAFSQLFVAIPVRSEGRVVGAVLIRRTLELNYPLNNRLIVNRGLADQLNVGPGTQVEFNFSRDAPVTRDGRYRSEVLVGIDSSKVGTVTMANPSRSAFLEGVGTTFHVVHSTLWLLLLALACATLGSRLSTIPSLLVRSIAVTGLIWVARYVLVWFDLPSSVIHTGIFDPSFFASKFGNGLAKSIGELLLTDAALFANTFIVGRWILLEKKPLAPVPGSFLVRWFFVFLSAALVFLLLRGYGAAIRSAVFDSTLRYNDPMVIVPSFELGVMVMSLFLLSLCLIAVSVGLVAVAFTFIAGAGGTGKKWPWLITAAVFALAAVLFGVPLASPLVSLPYRILFAMAVVGFTIVLFGRNRRGRSMITPQTPLMALALSALFFYLILDDTVHDRDRERMESYAQQVVKPSDSWLRFMADEALQEFGTEETSSTILTGDDDALDRLAFDHWAHSTIAREGYNCIFAVTDSSGSELSRFMIGGEATPEMYNNLPMDRPRAKRIVVHRDGTGVNAIRIYSGSIPITSGDGRLLGYGRVVVAASQQTLFRGDSPPVLRSQSSEPVETFHRPITISEFHDGRLLSSTTTMLPINYELPGKVQKTLADSAVSTLWSDEQIDDKDYETFYVKRASTPNQVIALMVPKLGTTWHLIEVIKVFVYYGIVVLVFMVGLFVVERLRGRRYQFTFRDKLLGALLVTALLPLVIMATYGRQFARERLMNTTAKRLEQETATLGVSIEQRLQGEEGIVQEALSRYEIDRLADEAGTDFNLYVGNQLQASSRPELYDAGVLDKRLSGLAFANTILKGKRFYVQTETIGSYEYAVGYRPLVGGAGRIVGIVAVPTLYRIEEVEEEIAQQNALVFGIYAIVVFAIVIIATTFANRIAAPIHGLTLATKRVARGDLNVTVGVSNADGEIGELIRSFEVMTRELARSRENLVRFERELAWKEMAKQVAHEIKNPLTPMKLSLQHLRQMYKDGARNFEQVFNEMVKTVIEQIDTLSRIAGEFARFARMPQPVLESVDVNAVLRESILLFEQDADVTFDLALQEGLPTVRSDREELRRAFINIIRNGIQAVNNSGRITIRSLCEQGWVVVSIHDDGVGMSGEVKAKLFEPNFSTKSEGMGLGLAITKKSIDDVGGSISIESEEGKGTTVTISLPIGQ